MKSARTKTTVENYWNNYTIVKINPINNLNQSLEDIKTIDRLYPLYTKLFGLYKSYEDKIILDYGCGPGNDLVGFYLFSNCKKIVGADISHKAISEATKRLNLHKAPITGDVTDGNGLTFLHVNEQDNKMYIGDDFFDYIQSSGVIHHTTYPKKILKELYRVLKPDCILNIMMYHRNSIYIRLTLCLEIIRKNIKMDVYNYFENTGRADSGAPIAFLSDNKDFTAIGNEIGFKAKFKNAAFSCIDLRSILDIPYALNHSNFPEKHKAFLRNITYEEHDILQVQPICKNKLSIDRLYELTISVNNSEQISLKYKFDGLTNKGFYHASNNFFLKINSNTCIIKKKLYSFKENLIVTEINNNFSNCNIILTQIYPLYNGYYPGINAIYEFKK